MWVCRDYHCIITQAFTGIAGYSWCLKGLNRAMDIADRTAAISCCQLRWICWWSVMSTSLLFLELLFLSTNYWLLEGLAPEHNWLLGNNGLNSKNNVNNSVMFPLMKKVKCRFGFWPDFLPYFLALTALYKSSYIPITWILRKQNQKLLWQNCVSNILMMQLLKYQKCLFLQPEHIAVSLTDQRDLAGIRLKPKQYFLVCLQWRLFSSGRDGR